MFLPQVVLAVLASRWGRNWHDDGACAGFCWWDLPVIWSRWASGASHLLLGAPDVAFGFLLVATGALGLGFGATVMALNTYAETFFPASADQAVLVLNALLG